MAWEIQSVKTIGGRTEQGAFDDSKKGIVVITLVNPLLPEEDRHERVTYTKERVGANSWAAFRTMVKKELKIRLDAMNAAADTEIDETANFQPV